MHAQSPPLDRLHRAVARAREALWHFQRPDGSWQDYNYGGPVFTAMTLCVERYLEVLRPDDADKGVSWLRAQQLADGSFQDYPFADKGSVFATSCVYAGLHAAGVPLLDPAMQRAMAFIQAAGGWEGINDMATLFLAMSGVIDPMTLKQRFSLPLLLPQVQRVLGRHLTGEIILVLNQTATLAWGLQHGRRRPDPLRDPVQALTHRLCERYLSSRQNPIGDWVGVFPSTALGLASLYAMGVPVRDERMARGLAAMERWKVRTDEGLYVVPFTSEVWSTAQVARTLVGCGADPEDPRILRAVAYLLRQQNHLPLPPEFQAPRPGAPRSGGWAFEEGNEYNPDTDTTAEVLATLAQCAPRERGAALQQAMDRGLGWLLGMQNPDGAWGVFAYGHRTKEPGPMKVEEGQLNPQPIDLLRYLVRPPIGFGDESCEEMAGRILHGLAHYGYGLNHPVVQRAVAFIKAQRDPRGIWWGRWTVNYLVSTSFVLSGLRAVGEDMGSDYVRRAVSWLLSHQQPDGGWGETVATYLDPTLAGGGPSTSSQTGIVLWALMDAGEGDNQQVARGIEYLLERQRADGFWQDNTALKALQPPTIYYSDIMYPKYAPLRAIARYLAEVSGKNRVV